MTARRAARTTAIGRDTSRKARGATYTPSELAGFLADRMVRHWRASGAGRLRVLDPAVGDGELLHHLLERLPPDRAIDVVGFDIDASALRAARKRLARADRDLSVRLHRRDFLATYAPHTRPRATYDLVIANPPYVRTQVLGTSAAQELAKRFGLTGRVDLCHAFVLAIARVLRPTGVAGIIVSNRFMSTRAGARVRAALRERFALAQVWDLGDTRLFPAAVLPAVVVLSGLEGGSSAPPAFTSIYETAEPAVAERVSVVAALDTVGCVAVPDGRRFRVQRGTLDLATPAEAVWRVTTDERAAWLATVGAHTWGVFGDLGPIHVGVKTCADAVFIRDDWDAWPADERPELLRPVTTHAVARRFRAAPRAAGCAIVYPHEVAGGRRRAVDLDAHPRTRAYLEAHRTRLERRTYVRDAGRQWYEIWVPQDPAAWARPKLVFRDIARRPCFWFDRADTVVNGDCYWLAARAGVDEDRLWLALAVANSSFAERYYDLAFGNQLYGGRRRFITQYVERFPLPDPHTATSRAIAAAARNLYDRVGTPEGDALDAELDAQVWVAFGV